MKPDSGITVAGALENLSRESAVVLNRLKLFQETGSFFEDGSLLRSDLFFATENLSACSVLPSFDQSEYRNLLLKRVGKWDRRRDVEEPLATMGGGVLFPYGLMACRLLTGSIPDEFRHEASVACDYLLDTDRRPEWHRREWSKRVWHLSARVLMSAYWLDSRELAEDALSKRWMPGGKSVESWNDVSAVWTRNRMEWLDFAFWRYWWVSTLGRQTGEDLDLNRVLSHAVFLFHESLQINGSIADYLAMSHALYFPKRWPMEIREIVAKLLLIEAGARPWK